MLKFAIDAELLFDTIFFCLTSFGFVVVVVALFVTFEINVLGSLVESTSVLENASGNLKAATDFF